MFLDYAFLTRLGLWDPLDKPLSAKSFPASPNIGTIRLTTNKTCIGSCKPEFLINNPGPVLHMSVGPKRGSCGATTRKLEDWYTPVASPIRSWPETRYARLLSGCRHAVRICWISLTLVRSILSTGFRGYSGLPTLELRLRGSWACNGSSWNTPAGFELSKAVPAVMWQMGAC